MQNRTKKWLKRAGIAAAGIGLIVGVGVWNAAQSNAVLPVKVTAVPVIPSDNSVNTYKIKDKTIGGWDMLDNTIPWSKFGSDFRGEIRSFQAKSDAATKAANAAAAAAAAADAKAQQALDKPGTPGTPGADAILTVTADTMVTGRDDTATDGSVWAKDSMTRTLTVVRQHAAEAAKCGAGAVKCWFYTGTIKDNGTFTTLDGAHGPNSTTPISGIVNGTVNGVYEIEFYANSDVPNSTHVDSTVTGSSPSTSNWMKLAFPTGTQFAGFNGLDYTWVYTAPNTCETHTQTTAANTGDILGKNLCTK
jgi:hypothetical protein